MSGNNLNRVKFYGSGFKYCHPRTIFELLYQLEQFNLENRLSFGHRIEVPLTHGVTSNNSPKSESEASQPTVSNNTFGTILRTTWMKATMFTNKWGHKLLVPGQ